MGSPRKNPPGGYLGTWRYVFRLLIYSLLLFVPILIPGPGLYFFTSIILSSFLPFYPCFILDPIHYPNHYPLPYPILVPSLLSTVGPHRKHPKEDVPRHFLIVMVMSLPDRAQSNRPVKSDLTPTNQLNVMLPKSQIANMIYFQEYLSTKIISQRIYQMQERYTSRAVDHCDYFIIS